MNNSFFEQVNINGYGIFRDQISPGTISGLRNAFNRCSIEQEGRRKRAVFGMRNILATMPLVEELSQSPEMTDLAEGILGAPSFPVRGIYFDKPTDANWHLPWHQDQAIAVQEKIDVEGYYGWSVKEEVPHVIPPLNVLQRMVALRVHLDDCGEENGPLNVLPGSHLNGRIAHKDIESMVANGTPMACTCKKGDIVAMKPLTLHSSRPATAGSHRRVVHIEYASCNLDGGLEWYFRTDNSPAK